MKRFVLILLVPFLFIGCAAHVPMENPQQSQLAKQFNPPSKGKAGLYIYRLGTGGGFAYWNRFTKTLSVNGECLGKIGSNVFFYEEIPGDMEHVITTASQILPNHLSIYMESGKNYFVREYARPGVVPSGSANVELVDEAEGKAAIANLEMAAKGNCSKSLWESIRSFFGVQ